MTNVWGEVTQSFDIKRLNLLNGINDALMIRVFRGYSDIFVLNK